MLNFDFALTINLSFLLTSPYIFLYFEKILYMNIQTNQVIGKYVAIN